MPASSRSATRIVVGGGIPRGTTMAMSFSVTTLTAPRTALKETRYGSIEDALAGANYMLGDGAISVWIVDRAARTGWIASAQPSSKLIGNRTSSAPFASNRRLASARLI
jgi:hypothetical protein